MEDDIRLPVDVLRAPPSLDNLEGAALGQVDVSVTPLQMVMAAASLSNGGSLPVPQLVTAFQDADGNWVIMPPEGEPSQVLPATDADRTANYLAVMGEQWWQSLAVSPNGPEQTVSWFLGGSLPNEDPTSLQMAIALVLEEDNVAAAQEIGQSVLKQALLP